MPAAPTRSDSLRIRARLLQEAREMLDADGAPVPLNALARRAGVGVGTVYRHFPTSQHLVAALAADGIGELEREVRAASDLDDAWAGIERVVAAQVRLELDGAGVREVLAAASTSDGGDRDGGGADGPQPQEAMREMATLVDDLLRRAWDAGQLGTRIDARDLRNLLCGVGFAAALVPAAGRHEVAQRYAAIVLGGLRA